MSLAARLEAARQPVKPKFEQWIERLPADDRAALIAAAADPELTNAAIVDAVRAEGGVVGKDAVAAWRKSHGLAR